MSAFRKTECPISRRDFVANAKPVEVVINGIPMLATVKQFQTGSVGWYLTGKVNVLVGDVAVPTQLGLTLTAIGSKDLPKDVSAAA
jgi:hypothetical protein